MYDYIIIDSNNWYTKTHSVNESMVHKVGQKSIITGGIYGFLKSFQKWQRDYASKDTIFYFLFDNATSKSNLRQQMIDPTYKENRKNRPKSFYRSIDMLRLILENYDSNLYCIYGTGYEADDIVPYVLKQLEKDAKVLLMSEDMDWSRLISDNVHQYMKKVVFDKHAFFHKYGFTPSLNKIVLYKTIRGDSSDDIPIGIVNFPSKLLIKIIDDYKDIYQVLDHIKNINYLSDKWKSAFKENKNRLILNYQLVSFFKINEKFVKECTTKGKFNAKQLKILYDSLGFSLYEVDKRVYNIEKKKEIKNKGYTDSFLLPPEVFIKRK